MSWHNLSVAFLHVIYISIHQCVSERDPESRLQGDLLCIHIISFRVPFSTQSQSLVNYASFMITALKSLLSKRPHFSARLRPMYRRNRQWNRARTGTEYSGARLGTLPPPTLSRTLRDCRPVHSNYNHHPVHASLLL